MRLSFKYILFSFESLIICSLIVVNIDRNEAKNLPKSKLCANIDCKEPIGLGRTNAGYAKGNEAFVSFRPQLEVKIFAKTEDEKYFDIEVDGKRGFAPKSHITEVKTYTKDLVAVQITSNETHMNSETNVQNSSETVHTNKESEINIESTESPASGEPLIYSSLSEQSTESQTMTPTRSLLTVVDGTTFMDEDIEINSSPTDSSVPTTATKTPTISVKLNESDSKALNESNDSSLVNTTDSQVIEPSVTTASVESSDSAVPQTEPETEVESEEKSEDQTEAYTQSNDKSNDLNDKENETKSDSEISDNSSENNTKAIESPNESIETNDSSTEDNSESSVNALDKSTLASDDIKTDKSPEDIEASVNESKKMSDSSDIEHQNEAPSQQTTNENLDNLLKKSDDLRTESAPVTHILEIKPTPNQTNSDVNNNSSEDNNVLIEKDSKKPSFIGEVSENEEKLLSKSNLEENNLNSESNNVKTDDNSETIENLIESENTETNDESPKNINIGANVDNTVVNEINTNISSDSQEEIVIKDENQLSDSLSQSEPNIHLNSKEVDLPIVIPEEEPEIDPIPDQIDNFDYLKDKISDPEFRSIDPIIESQEMFKWMGLESMGMTKFISDVIPDEIELILKDLQISAQVVVFTFIITFNWCLMKILLSIFSSSKKETELRNICCKAERQIYYFEAEKQKLQTEIDRETEKARMAEERMHTAEHKVIPLEREFIKIKNERDQLHQKMVNLESELESAAEAGLEANRLLSDFLTSQKENINLNSSVDALQQQITKQAEIVTKYESTAKQKEKENRELKEKSKKMSSELERMKNLLKETEHNLHIFQTNNEELKASKSELSSSLSQLEEEYSNLQKRSEDYFHRNEELSIDFQKLTTEINELKEQINLRDKEIESWKQMARLSKSRKLDINSDEEQNEEEEELDQIDSDNYGQSMTDLYDIVKMDIQLKNLTNDKNDLMTKLEEVSEQCRQLTDKIKGLEVDNQTLKNEREIAEKDKIKAENKLEVLTDHYRAKELEFGKEIGVQAVQRRIKEEDADSLANQLVDLKEENTSLRSQLVSMKKEVEDSERKYKSNINQLEKQVHENWILARNAERKLDEAKAEASVLRQTLTMSVKSPVDGFGGDASYLDDSASSISDHFGGAMPPPPPPPMPPPPPIFGQMIPPMHMQFGEENDATALWNQTMTQSMNQMPIPGIPPHFPPMPAFNHIPSDVSMNANMSFANSQPVNFVPQMQQMGQQWDSTSNRDTYSPSPSHRSTSSPHLQYNMYSQPNSHYSNPMTSMSSPMTNSSMSAQFHNPMTAVTSPLLNSSQAVLSEPTPLHWTQPQRPNGNVPNFNYSHNQYNESEGSSRPTSRNDRNDNSLHTSIV